MIPRNNGLWRLKDEDSQIMITMMIVTVLVLVIVMLIEQQQQIAHCKSLEEEVAAFFYFVKVCTFRRESGYGTEYYSCPLLCTRHRKSVGDCRCISEIKILVVVFWKRISFFTFHVYTGMHCARMHTHIYIHPHTDTQRR